jgi:hypothetical protein
MAATTIYYKLEWIHLARIVIVMFYSVKQKLSTRYMRKYCSVGFTNQHSNFARLIKKPQPPLLLIRRQNFVVNFVNIKKTELNILLLFDFMRQKCVITIF